jgi:hypothetical protein
MESSNHKQSLYDLAELYFSKRSEMPVFAQDDSKELLITLDFKDGAPLVIVSMRADGVTPD